MGANRVGPHAPARAARDVLLGNDPPVALTRRAGARLTEAREAHPDVVHPVGTAVARGGDGDGGVRRAATEVGRAPGERR
ncbi:hypothetical protein OG920_27845 [Streptomyces europaeiscabiei]|uniref:hypothetical protein n=1 Tax=Streptomyces europaeiscabiei TaxID=146819 RepID=UPI0030E02E90